MNGLGKPRSKFGKFIDKEGIKQEWLVKETKLSRNAITRLCDGSRDDSKLYIETKQKVISALRKQGYDVRMTDFW